MELIDDEGRVLGVVNVIDALVALLVAAVVVAGVALVFQPESPSEPESTSPPEMATRQVVLDLGTQPGYVVEQIETGDSFAPSADNNLTVTDVYLGPRGGGARVVLGVDLTGPVANGSISYNGAPLRLGRQLAIETDTYQVTGVLRDVDNGLVQDTERVLVETNVSSTTSTDIQQGDAYSIAGRVVGTVESVHVFGTQNPDEHRVMVGLVLQIVDLGDGQQFGSTPIQTGSTIPFRTDEYALSGTVRRVGASELRGEPATRTVTLVLRNAPPHLSSAVQAGATETIAGETNAMVEDVERSPATLVVTGDDGTVYVRDHPTRQDLKLTVELSVRQMETGLTFKGRTIRPGSTVVLDLGTVTVQPTVTSLRG